MASEKKDSVWRARGKVGEALEELRASLDRYFAAAGDLAGEGRRIWRELGSPEGVAPDDYRADPAFQRAARQVLAAVCDALEEAGDPSTLGKEAVFKMEAALLDVRSQRWRSAVAYAIPCLPELEEDPRTSTEREVLARDLITDLARIDPRAQSLRVERVLAMIDRELEQLHLESTEDLDRIERGKVTRIAAKLACACGALDLNREDYRRAQNRLRKFEDENV